jgi:hypothetical protein
LSQTNWSFFGCKFQKKNSKELENFIKLLKAQIEHPSQFFSTVIIVHLFTQFDMEISPACNYPDVGLGGDKRLLQHAKKTIKVL